MKRRLPLLALLPLAVVVSACPPSNDKGNSAAPCCGATGQVEEPATAFAGGVTFDGIRIRPVVYDTSECPTFSDPDPLGSFLDMERAGETVDVDAATGVFELQLTENALGQRVAFVVCDNDCDSVLGIGLLGAEVVATESGEFLVVAPIQLVAPSGALGASTLELLSDCELDSRDIRGNLLTADVRHVISPLVGFSAAPSSAEVDDLMARMQLFDAALEGPIAFASSSDAATFIEQRETIESLVDACRGGEAPVGCLAPTDLDAEHFRYWQYARLPVSPVPTPAPVATAGPQRVPPEDQMLPFAMLLWTQQIADDLGPTPPLAADTLAESLLRQHAMFRYELMEKAITDAVTTTQFQDLSSGTDEPLSLTFSSAGLPSINQSLATIRSAIQAGSMTTPNSIYQPWALAAGDIGRNIDVQLSAQATGTFEQLMLSAFDIGSQMQGNLDGTETPEQALLEIYADGTGSGGAYQLVFNQVGSAIAGHSLIQQIAMTDIVYFSMAQASSPVMLGVN